VDQATDRHHKRENRDVESVAVTCQTTEAMAHYKDKLNKWCRGVFCPLTRAELKSDPDFPSAAEGVCELLGSVGFSGETGKKGLMCYST